MSCSISLFWDKWKAKKDMHPNFWKNNHCVQLQPRKGTNYEYFVLFGQMKNMYSTNLTAALPLDENRLQWRSQCAENSKDIQIERCAITCKNEKELNNGTMKQWFDAKRLLRCKSYDNITILLPHCLIHWRRQKKVILKKEKRKWKRGILDANPLIRQLFYSANFHQTTFFPSSSL